MIKTVQKRLIHSNSAIGMKIWILIQGGIYCLSGKAVGVKRYHRGRVCIGRVYLFVITSAIHFHTLPYISIFMISCSKSLRYNLGHTDIRSEGLIRHIIYPESIIRFLIVLQMTTHFTLPRGKDGAEPEAYMQLPLLIASSRRPRYNT